MMVLRTRCTHTRLSIFLGLIVFNGRTNERMIVPTFLHYCTGWTIIIQHNHDASYSILFTACLPTMHAQRGVPVSNKRSDHFGFGLGKKKGRDSYYFWHACLEHYFLMTTTITGGMGGRKNRCFLYFLRCNDECNGRLVYLFIYSSLLSDTYHHSSAGICKEGLLVLFRVRTMIPMLCMYEEREEGVFS